MFFLLVSSGILTNRWQMVNIIRSSFRQFIRFSWTRFHGIKFNVSVFAIATEMSSSLITSFNELTDS